MQPDNLNECTIECSIACYIDLIIINRPKLFQLFQTSSMTVENGLPGSHKRDYTFMTSTRKWVGDLEICQEFVNSITECLRDFQDSNVLNKIYLFISVNNIFVYFCEQKGCAREGVGEGFIKLVIFCKHHNCMTPNEVNGNKSVL